jgi:predicted kinase
MSATLHLLCGKIAAGKSTLAAALGAAALTAVISEDDWLPRLYPGEITSLAEYVRYSARLRGAMEGHVATLLRAGLSVVLDFPANTVAQRAWMRGLIEAAGTAHVLHYLNVPDTLCLARLSARNLARSHPYQVSDADFAAFTAHFVPPAPEEGFHVTQHVAEACGP